MDTVNKCLVSVIIPTFKRSDKLPRAIDSVLNSSYSEVEVIVVDDNNPHDEYRERTEALMNKLYSGEPRVCYLKHSHNMNGSAARNTGFHHSKGKYIMFLDDDDEFLPFKIEKQLECLENSDSSWGACYTRYIDVNDKGKIISVCHENKSGKLLDYELARNLFVHAGSNLMVRREVVEALNGFDESFVRNQDVEFLVRILKKYQLKFVNYIGLKVYVHPRKYLIDYREITRKYIEKFECEISLLPQGRQEAVRKMIALQLVRNSVERHDVRGCMKLKKEHQLSFLIIFLYFSHLFYRKLTRGSYGFNMKYLR